MISPWVGAGPAASHGPEGSDASTGAAAAVVDGVAVVEELALVDATVEVDELEVLDALVDELLVAAIGRPDDPEHATVVSRQPATKTALTRTSTMLGRSVRTRSPGRERIPLRSASCGLPSL